MPERIQRKRTRGWTMPANTVYVGRPTKWGNPFRPGKNGNGAFGPDGCRVAINGITPLAGGTPYQFLRDAFEAWLEQPELADYVAEIRRELRGKNLACWCPLDQPCHADVLLEMANA